MQVYFKEHGRSGSKDSKNSFISRKKQPAAATDTRPETKVSILAVTAFTVADGERIGLLQQLRAHWSTHREPLERT